MEKKDKMGIGKFWGWQARAVSMGCMVIILGYLNIYCTDTLMLSSAVVGILLLVSKITDGITDLIAGYIIDNTHTKWGKARPYEVFIIALWICTWLLFSCPAEWSDVLKYIWVFIMYTLVNSIFATFLYSNQTPYMLRAFGSQQQIVKVNSYGGIVVTLGCAVVSMLFPQMMATMATSASGWSRMVGMFAIPLCAIGLLRFLLVKETVEIDNGETERVTLKDMLGALKSNKYIFMAAGISLLYNLVQGMNAYTYYFTYIGGGIDKYTSLAALSMPLLIVMFIFPQVMKRGITTSRIILFGAICGVVGWGLNFFAGDNMAILMIAAVLYTFAGLPIAYISGLLLLDCSEYNVLTGKKRMETTMSAVSSFGTKIGQGVGNALLGIMLAVFGYNGAAEVQTADAVMGIRCLYSVIPAVIYLLIVIICMKYDLEKILPGLREKAKAGKRAE
ncbi:hypothetical protein B5F07_12195 [Lachnoclostridium sp. An169]|uniref:MFS transporter n=1 Tax=Lachnoclostridium sp. An169 TaxID=1965569 RepID=UPI000B365233|nr:MFS transporter [Lachnoclostridium sp. An169]OUP82926.1 hypothetical protein B5F07_12195 [Lachnoclostridium sp. An169]